MPKENNKVDINKHENDIDTLFKQNVNDLSSIKELYRKLQEVNEKISQIKYIDSTLAYKLKKEYEKLKKIILDENIQVKLTNDIETINLQMDTKTSKEEIKNIQVKLTNDIESINSKLDTITQEVEKPITLNKCDSEMLAAIQNKEGETTFNLLSIPRDSSVTPSKLDSTIKDSIFNIEKFDDTSSSSKGVVGGNNVFLLNKEFINCILSKMVIKFTQPAAGEIRIYENENGVLNEVESIEFDTTELGGLNPTIEINYIAKNAYIGITKTSGVVIFGSFVTYGLLTYSDKTQTTFNISDCEVFDNFSLPFCVESLTLKSNDNDKITEDIDKITEDIDKITEDIDNIKDNILTSVNVERSEILKNKQVYLENGVEKTGNIEWNTSDFIDISNGAVLVGYGLKSFDGIAFYDENKNYVTSTKPSIPTTSNSIFKAEITIKNGQYKYCRVVSCVYNAENEYVGSISTFTDAIEKLENRVTFLEKNIGTGNTGSGNTGSGIIGTVNNNIITVGKTGCDFTEIQLAINSITDDSPTNRYLILVFPGTYNYFHTWVYGVRPYGTQRYISIVGVSKYDCIVDSAFNSTFTSNGILKNMTLICNNTDINTDGLVMYEDYDSEYGYALHIDMKQKEIKGTKIVIEDCDLISYKGSTVGMGCWKDDVITFKRCNIIRKENISKVNHHASKMAFYCHNGPSGTTNQNLNLIDCNISTPYDYAMYLHDTSSKGDSPSYLYCTFINNNIYSAINGFNCITGQSVTNEQALFGLGIILTENSYGNTNNLLNNNIGNTLTYR